MISVIAACPQSFFLKDSRQAGMTYNVILLMNSLVNMIKNIERVFHVFMSVVIIASMLFISVIIHSTSLPATENKGAITINIDAGQEIDKVPYLFRTGVFLNSLPVEYPEEKFFGDLKPGMLEFSWDFYPELLNSSSYDDFFNKLPESNLTKWVKQTAKSGGDVYIRLMPVPKWLWSRPNGARKAPGDYNGWAKFVGGLVNYYNNKLKINAKYIVWDEPDVFWEGTKEEYFELYKYSVLGAKSANRNAMIGGPAIGIFSGRIHDFIQYCASTSLTGFGNRLPIDILIWHKFDALPTFHSSYKEEISKAKEWLKKFGYSENVELNMGSWTVLESYKSIGPDIPDTEYLASYVVSSVIAMADAGFQRHAFFNLFEDWRLPSKRSEFAGELGLLTRNFVIKPAYNAFLMLNMIDGDRLKIIINDPLITSYASRSKENIFILISNFIPPKVMSIQAGMTDLRTKGYDMEDLKQYGLNKNSLLDIVNKKGDINNFKIPPQLKEVIKKWTDYIQTAEVRQKKPIDIEIKIENLPFKGKIRYSQYLIDSNHSNSYSVKEKIEKVIETDKNEAKQKAKEYLSKKWDKQEIEKLENLINLKVSLSELLEKLPKEKRIELLEAKKINREYLFRKIEEINKWPNVKLQKAEEDTLEALNSFRKTISLKPYAVTLIVLQKLDR